MIDGEERQKASGCIIPRLLRDPEYAAETEFAFSAATESVMMHYKTRNHSGPFSKGFCTGEELPSPANFNTGVLSAKPSPPQPTTSPNFS
jgi:hypothetical protein